MPRGLAVAQAAALAGLLGLAGLAGAERPRVRVLAAFDEAAAARNAGAHHALARPPSVAALRGIPEGGGRALEVSGRHAPGGSAGVWLAFHGRLGGREQFIDASGFDYLTFRIRADARPPRLLVKLADAAWAAKADALEVGELTRFLPQDIGTGWQQVAIPLGGLPLDLKALAGLTLAVDSPGEFAFVIDDLALKRDPEDALPAPRGVP